MRRELWKISGHEANYGDNMYPPMELDDAEYRLKPMNCPGHILIYKSSPKSYRDLPVRYAELGNVYRYERSGTMHGLLRVRGFTQDDAHIFCTPQQIEDEIAQCIDFAEAVLRTFGFAEFKVELSTWDPKDKKFIGSAERWEQAVGALKTVLDTKGIPFRTIPGEAAFYGPKIDIKLVDVLGRMWQLSTVQFDWNLPERFDLAYKGEDGELHQPVMVHRALFGSVERFFGVLIEHYAGAFPLWLAPVQVALVPISSDKHVEYARSVKARLEAAGLRVELDERNEKMNAKIREFGLQKVPFILIVGDKEAATDSVSVRVRAKGDEGSVTVAEFVARCAGLLERKGVEL
jgi:threonyl-tRNA synthetase